MTPSFVVVATSGALDPMHVGHVRYLLRASAMARARARKAGHDAELVHGSGWAHVHLLNSDAWLARVKARAPLIAFAHRLEIVRAIKGVSDVMACGDDRDDVIDALAQVREGYPADSLRIFAKGGDRLAEEIPEAEWCKANGWEIVDGVGGRDKDANSSALASRLGLVLPGGKGS